MAENQAPLLVLIVFAAYLITKYWKKILFLVTVLSVTIFIFGICGIVTTFYGDPRLPGSQATQPDQVNRQGRPQK